MNRRQFLAASGGLIGALSMAGLGAAPQPHRLRNPIPSSGEMLPAIGMGTWITFNVGNDAQARAARGEVLRTFFEHGGGMVDSSPMYGSAEAVVGDLLARQHYPSGLFSATKVWTWSGDDGPHEIEASRRLWGVDRFDLLQVHNLLAWRPHLETLLAMKADGRLRYVGVTTSHGRRHAELEQVMRDWPLDFVQLTYNAVDREAEQRLLPLAAERGIAVIVNRPFRGSSLIDQVKQHPLPAWAAEIDCQDWAGVLLKFIVSHPAVTCAIPATSRVDHMVENMRAMQGRMPDAQLRERIIAHVENL
ncbi:MAG: aldo/keto reductase [Gammaproteobacteria bacterium]|nr:aldo/keto reductase [Gammaproteobacteria bacterium]